MPHCTRAAVAPELATVGQTKSVAWIDCLMGRLFRWLNTPLIKQTGGEIARECRPAAWEHVLLRACEMSPAQVRGYTRAIAPNFVAREVDAVLRRRRVRVSLREPIVAEAIEQLTALIVADFVRASARDASWACKQVA
jgi:hypothetical protein